MSDEIPLFRCMTKAVIRSKPERDAETATTTTHGTHWILSRRAILKVYSDRLVCGADVINYSDIKKAVLYSLPRQLLVVPCFLLVIETQESVYQFGLNGWNSFWKQELPFPAERQKGTIGYSYFSIAVRIIFVVALVHWIIKHFL